MTRRGTGSSRLPGPGAGVRVSRWAPQGNEANLEFADFAAWFADQPDTGAIAAYVEGFKDGRTLMLAADHAAQRGVPIVMVKVGRTAEGASTAQSHTGHLTGRDQVTDGVLRQFGVHRVDGLDELTDTAAMLARSGPPSADGVCIYGISGGTAAHLADLFGVAGLSLPELGADTQAALDELIPDYLRTSNPVDCGGTPVLDERGRKILDAVVADPAIGVVVCPITGALPQLSEPLARDLVDVAGTTDKPICVIWGSPLTDDPAYRVLVDSPVPLFRTFDNSAAAGAGVARPPRVRGAVPVGVRRAGRLGGHRAVAGGRRRRAPDRRRRRSALRGVSTRVLSTYGVDVPREHVCRSRDEAVAAARSLGAPVVMKVSADGLAHKSELGLVRLGVGTARAVEDVWSELLAAARDAGVEEDMDGMLVAEQLSGGVECIAGVTRDPLFGQAVMFGLGGVHAEVFEDVAFRVPPFDRDEARPDDRRDPGLEAAGRDARGRRRATAMPSSTPSWPSSGWRSTTTTGSRRSTSTRCWSHPSGMALDALVVCR
ncbi:MAG: acetate--CoA ligase family protein [Acidimicrobiia bacterium]|nr:acetate--CoA ligase family protein [Acidimicrobiia bacterium]